MTAIDLHTLREANILRQTEWPNSKKEDTAFRAICLFEEAGEIGGAVAKMLRGHMGIMGSVATLPDVSDEIGDTLIALDLLLWKLDVPAPAFHPLASKTASLPEWVLVLAKRVGDMEEAVLRHLRAPQNGVKGVLRAASDLLSTLWKICETLNIDFHETWIIKFNKTSEKHGMRTQVDPHCGNPVVSVAPKEGGLL